MRQYFREVKSDIFRARRKQGNGLKHGELFAQAHERTRQAITRVAKSRGLNAREIKAMAKLMEAVHHDGERDHYNHGKAWLTAARLERKGLAGPIDHLHDIASELRRDAQNRVVGAGVHPINGVPTMAFFINPPAAMANVAQSAKHFLRHPAQHAEEVRKMGDERIRKALVRYIKERTRPRQLPLSFRRQELNVQTSDSN